MVETDKQIIDIDESLFIEKEKNEEFTIEIRDNRFFDVFGDETFDVFYKNKQIITNMKTEDFANIISGNKRMSNKIYSKFLVHILAINKNADISKIQEQIREELSKFIIKEKEEKKPDIKSSYFDIIENTSFKDIKPTRIEEYICIGATQPKYKPKNPLYLALVSPPSSGKTEILDRINDFRIINWTEKMTKNALLSGSPNIDAEDNYSILINANNKCLIINDASIIIGLGVETIANIIGILTNAYGRKTLVLESPGGRREIHSYFTITWGMTPLQYNKLKYNMNIMGNRFLIYNMPSDWEQHYYDQDDFNHTLKLKRKKSLVSHILNTQNKYENLPKVSKKVKEYIRDFAEKVIILRNLAWNHINEEKGNIENPNRLTNCLITCASTRAMLWGRTQPTLADAELFFPLAIPTIYRIDLLRKLLPSEDDLYHERDLETIFKGVDKVHFRTNMMDNIEDLKIYKNPTLTGEWKDFFKKYIKNYNSIMPNELYYKKEKPKYIQKNSEVISI